MGQTLLQECLYGAFFLAYAACDAARTPYVDFAYDERQRHDEHYGKGELRLKAGEEDEGSCKLYGHGEDAGYG